MPPRDLSDVNGWMERWEYKLTRFFSGAFLENASVTQGLLRFIGGVLKLDSGATLDGDGRFRWRGKGTIEGDFEVLGDGWIKVGGVTIRPLGGGRIEVGENIVLDASDGGKITAGEIRIEKGHVYVGDDIDIDGTANVIRIGTDVEIDGATGQIKVGEMILDPSENGGTIKFPQGGEVYASNGTLSVYSSSAGAYVTLAGDAAEVHGPGLNWIRIDGTGIQMVGLPTIAQSTVTDSFLNALVSDSSGRVKRVVAG